MKDMVDYNRAKLKALGELVIKWTLEPDTRPTEVEDLNEILKDAGILEPGEKYEAFAIHARKKGEFSVLLPEPALIKESLDRFCDPMIDNRPANYDMLPDFYADLAFHKKAHKVSQEDMCDFYKLRVGDYSMGRCG